MAKRFVYVPINEVPFVEINEVEFKWEPGLSKSQRKKSSDNLHREAGSLGIANNILECSSANPTKLGFTMSAYNLPFYTNSNMSVESAYQGSKTFRNDETLEVTWMKHVYNLESKASKRALTEMETSNKHSFIGFTLCEKEDFWAIPEDIPTRYIFYTYIYVKSLQHLLKTKPEYLEELLEYDGFTDIMLRWHGGVVTSCQAAAVAMTIGMYKANKLDEIMDSREKFIEVYSKYGLEVKK